LSDGSRGDTRGGDGKKLKAHRAKFVPAH
jgi:hypothetical protein